MVIGCCWPIHVNGGKQWHIYNMYIYIYPTRLVWLHPTFKKTMWFNRDNCCWYCTRPDKNQSIRAKLEQVYQWCWLSYPESSMPSSLWSLVIIRNDKTVLETGRDLIIFVCTESPTSTVIINNPQTFRAWVCWEIPPQSLWMGDMIVNQWIWEPSRSLPKKHFFGVG